MHVSRYAEKTLQKVFREKKQFSRKKTRPDQCYNSNRRLTASDVLFSVNSPNLSYGLVPVRLPTCKLSYSDSRPQVFSKESNLLKNSITLSPTTPLRHIGPKWRLITQFDDLLIRLAQAAWLVFT